MRHDPTTANVSQSFTFAAYDNGKIDAHYTGQLGPSVNAVLSQLGGITNWGALLLHDKLRKLATEGAREGAPHGRAKK